MTEKVVVFSTCGSAEEASRVARVLVEKRLAACVNIVPGIQSVYHWQGAIEESAEFLLVIKSRRDLFDSLKREIAAAHSYTVPEIIALPIAGGSDSYLEWMDNELAASE